ncbi:MAG: hypothetical protein V3T77_08305, partial [Planctomycetota bacterium]
MSAGISNNRRLTLATEKDNCMVPRLCSLCLVWVVLLMVPEALRGDTVWRKNGSQVVGKILKQEPDRIYMVIQSGKSTVKFWIPRSEIDTIELGMTPTEEFDDRLGKLAPDDFKGYQELLGWAKKQRLRKQARSLEKEIPEVEWRGFKRDHPKSWCRTCDARGQRRCPQCNGEGQV